MKKQSKKDKAFMKKLQSLTVGCGAKPGNVPTCPDCGDPLQLAGIGVLMRHGSPPRNKPDEEQTVTE